MKDRLPMIILSVAEILIGVLLLVNPVGLTTWIIMTLGVIMVLAGVINVVQYFRTPAEEAAMKKSLVAGILCAMFGLWCVIRNDWIAALFPLLTTLYGVITLVNGTVKVQLTADMLRLKTGRWGWMALSAAVTIICAGVILAHPFSTTAVLWVFIGVTMIVEAVIDIAAAIFKKGKGLDREGK